MKKRTKYLAFLLPALILCVILCALAGSAFAEGDPTYTFDEATHTLTLTGGDFSKDNKWVIDQNWSYIGKVVAEPGVRFVGDCQSLFSGMSYVTEMDLHNVDVSQMTNSYNLFTGACSSLQTLNVAGWNLAGITDAYCLFGSCSRLKTLDLSTWDVSHITNFRLMFSGCSGLTSLNLSGWDVSSATNMYSMFERCSGLTTLNLSSWDVSHVTSMDSLFYGCTRLQNLNVANWDVSSVTDMDCLFYDCRGLTSLNVASWNIASVTSAGNVFNNCTGLTALDLTGWSLYNIYPGNAQGLFQGMTNLASLTLSPPDPNRTAYPDQNWWHLNNGSNGEGWVAEGTTQLVSGTGTYALIPAPAETTTFVWNPAGPRFTYDADTKALTLNYGDYDENTVWSGVPTASVKSVTAAQGVRFVGDCSGLFYLFEACESMDLHLADTSGMTSAQGMFAGCSALTALNVAGWNTSALTDLSYMLQYCWDLPSLDLSSWNTSAVENMKYAFHECKSLATLNVADWNTSAVTNMGSLFRDCYELTALDLTGWDVSSVTNMSHMFYSVCNELTTLDLSAWDFSSVTTMDYMFTECYSLATLTLPDGNISSVTDIEGMFKDCYALTALDLSGFSLTQMPVADELFSGANALAELTLPAEIGVGDFMCLNNGDYRYSAPGWIVKGDAGATVVSGAGEYAVIAPADESTTYVWLLNVADHPSAVTAFDAEGHWLYCPDCGRGLEGTYAEHDFDNYEDIDRVQITVPNSNAQSILDLPANTPIGVGNTVQFINDEDEMSFTYLPDDSGRVSCKDDESQSLYLPGGFATTPATPWPAFTNKYNVIVPGAAMDMWVNYDDCGYGYLEMLIAHGSHGKIWADRWFVSAGETVTFGVGSFPGYGCRIAVKSGGTEIPYQPTQRENEYSFTMPAGNVLIEPTFYELPALRLPGGTLTIGESAFENSGACVVYIPDGCTAIGPAAFKDCKSLQVIHIPASVTEIDDTAFDGCVWVYIYGERNSAAYEFYRTHHNVSFYQEGEA